MDAASLWSVAGRMGLRDVPRGLLIEPFIGTAHKLPIDYKLYVFNGRVEATQVHVEREQGQR
ncbi:hypothetical protein [Sphingomonas sp. BAUL-RG-20F-R05-02]|uniref:hypothetical protein n=1 Tax=Sphingomonas sp. BAUL-RG-20F-R05-02 TaxID=2914830 RepID=UPI001F578EB6|nr:hypothetical protein [Sphingomonas sp. BAUL-RG-20F-R05-02]